LSQWERNNGRERKNGGVVDKQKQTLSRSRPLLITLTFLTVTMASSNGTSSAPSTAAQVANLNAQFKGNVDSYELPW
jgi:hypothetical protein